MLKLKSICNISLIGFMAVAGLKCSSGPISKTVVKNAHVLTDSAYDVFLVAGQSNTYFGLGFDSVLDKPSKGIYQLGRVATDNMKVIEAKEPLQHYFAKPERIGFSMTFAKLYDSACGYKRNILIIPCGMDWTGFADSSWKRGDCLYNDAVERTNFVLKKYSNSKFVAILWCQGEKDVGNKKFTASLDSMISRLRKDIVGDNSKVPFIMGGMVPYWVELEKPREEQQELLKNTVTRMPYVAYVDPYKPFKITKENDLIDIYHYDAKGQREMGKRFFEAYTNLVNGKK